MSFEELLKHMSSATRKKEEIEVGKVSLGVVREFSHYKTEEERLISEVELEKKKLEMECQEKMRDKFDHKFEILEERKEFVWQMIYQNLGIDPNKCYRFSLRTGKVFMEVEDNDFAVSPQSNLYDDDQLH